MTVINSTRQKTNPPALITLLDALRREIQKEINCVKIGVVQSFNPGSATQAPTATVKIAQQQVTAVAPDGTKSISEYPLLVNVPIYFMGGGGATLTFGISEGNECIILFNDRQIDNWLTNGPGFAPSIGRVHDLSDGIGLVGLRSNPNGLAAISTDSAQLRTDDGSTYVEVTNGHIVNIVSPTQINLTAPAVVVSGTLDVQNVDSASVPCQINGSIHTTGDVVANGISLDSHQHSGVTTGGGDTGGPI